MISMSLTKPSFHTVAHSGDDDVYVNAYVFIGMTWDIGNIGLVTVSFGKSTDPRKIDEGSEHG